MTAVATFSGSDGPGGVAGTITLTQFGLPYTETSILVDLYYEVTVPELETEGHEFHVHEFALPGSGAEVCDLDFTGYHFDPYHINKDDPESPYECDHDTFFTSCEVGDTAGKVGMISLSSEGGKFFFTDSFLPLEGLLTVVGRSFVVHGTDGARIGCATIEHETENVYSNNNGQSTDSSDGLSAASVAGIAMGSVLAGSALVAIGWKKLAGSARNPGGHSLLSDVLPEGTGAQSSEMQPGPSTAATV